MLDVMAEAALRGAVLAAVVQLGLWVLRIRRAHLLLIAWTVVLGASLAMPALQWATPFQWPMVSGQPGAWLTGVADFQQQAVTAASPGLAPAGDVARLPTMEHWVDAAYLLVSGIMVLRLIMGVALSLRLLGKAVPVHLEAAPNVRIRISRAVMAPVTVGNVVLLPPDVMRWPPAMRQAALAHECAHVARGDFALLVVSQLYRALFWFSPVSWLLHRRLAALAELASDDHAMAVTGDRTGYAEVLLQMGHRSGPLLRGLAMARASTLRYRIERVLSDRVGAAPVSGVQRSMTVAGAAVVALAAASPDFRPAVPPVRIAPARLEPVVVFSHGATTIPVQTVDALPQLSLTEGTPASVERSPILLARVARLPPPATHGAARPMPQPMISNTHPLPPTHAVQVRNQSTDTHGDAVAHSTIEAVRRRTTSSGIVKDAVHSHSIGDATDVTHAPPSQRENYVPRSEPSLLKVIDQQTCDGVYLPGPVGGAQSSGWGSLNVIRAKFFQAADGTAWLKFYLGVRDPETLPMRVTGKEVEFIAAYNTAFKMLPQGTNHLTGTTERPSGNIDLKCGEVGSHIFDRKS